MNRKLFAAWILVFFLIGASSAFAQEVEPAEPLSLEDAVRIAFTSSPDVQAACERIEQARAAVEQAQAGFYPRLSISENFARTNYAPLVFTYELAQGNLSGSFPMPTPPGFDPFASFNNPDPLSDWNTQLLLQWPLFQGGKTYYGNRAAKAGVNAAEAQLESTHRDLALAVATAYYQILRTEKSIEIAEQSVRQIRQQLDVARARFENEVALKSDVLRVTVGLAEAENGLTIARHNLERAKSQLNLTMGRSINAPLALKGVESVTPVPPESKGTLPVLIGAARQRRPEVQAMQKTLASLENSVKVAKADYYPQVNAFGHYDIDTEDFSGSSDSWTVGVSANLSIFDGFLRRSSVHSARAKLREAEANYQKLLLGVEMDVKNAYLAESEAISRLNVLSNTVAEGEENYRIMSERYGAGVALVTDLLDAEVALTNARLQKLSAEYEYLIAAAALEHAVGQNIVEGPTE